MSVPVAAAAVVDDFWVLVVIFLVVLVFLVVVFFVVVFFVVVFSVVSAEREGCRD